MRRLLHLLLATSTVSGSIVASPRAQVTAPARSVILITIDGLRWQEFFGGADREYFKRDRNGSGGDPERRFWRDSPGDRRSVLLPFMWTTIANQGQILGDPAVSSSSRLTNGLWFSYPGYSEMFMGAADSAIDSNNKVPNPNVTVLEWLNKPSILNTDRSGIPVGSAWQPSPQPSTDRARVPSLAVRKSINVTASQVAATMAMLVGETFEGVTRPAAPAIRLR